MKRGQGWPIGIATVLAITVVANITLYYVANDDPSVAIEPDYYARAVGWDSVMVQARRNAALGWRLSPTLGAFSVQDGAVLRVTISDASGAPISDATVHVAALYTARANAVYDATLSHDRAGYASRLPVRHGGQWELRFEVTRGRDYFTSIARVEAVALPPGS